MKQCQHYARMKRIRGTVFGKLDRICRDIDLKALNVIRTIKGGVPSE